MKIAHHLDDATVIALAAGTLDEAMATVAAAHAVWCTECRRAIFEAEALGGTFLNEVEGTPVSHDCRDRALARLEGAAPHGTAPARLAPGDLPGPLARLVGGGLAEIRWRRLAPGIKIADATLSPGAKGKLNFLRVEPGKAIPDHGHGGDELTLVLKGAYRDRFGRFARGDVADLDEAAEHMPVAEGDEPCICVVATLAPTKFKSAMARLMQPLAGI